MAGMVHAAAPCIIQPADNNPRAAWAAQPTGVLWLDPNSGHKCRQLVMRRPVQNPRERNLHARQADAAWVQLGYLASMNDQRAGPALLHV